jgi:hypothetical protein
MNVSAYDKNLELFTVFCSSCGGEFRRPIKAGFSHCEHHDGLQNQDDVTPDILDHAAREELSRELRQEYQFR